MKKLILILTTLLTIGNAMANFLYPGEEILQASRAQLVDAAPSEIDTLINKHVTRLGYNPNSPQIRNRLNNLANSFALIESSGDLRAENPNSTAKGLYQFLIGKNPTIVKKNAKGQPEYTSLQTAVNRTKKYVNAPWLDEVFKTGNVLDLTKDQQTALFFGDIFEKEGSDQYLKKLLDPNNTEAETRDAMREIYLKLHHTDTADTKAKKDMLENLDKKLPRL